MSYYGHDMDHDGEITTKDCGMFHEMMEKDERAYSGQSYFTNREPWSVSYLIAKLLFLVSLGGIIALMGFGILPINGFTLFLFSSA